MKNYIVYFILLLTLVLTGACNNEWVEEVYVQNVGLKAPVNSKGVTDVYLRYRANGEVTYRLPVNVKVCLILNSNLTDWILLINGYFH